MSRAAHPMFRRLVQAAGTHGQLLLREQRLDTALQALGAGLGRVGFDDAPAWDRLLQSAWAEPQAGGGLQAVLGQLAQRDQAPTDAAALRRSRTPLTAGDAAQALDPERGLAGFKPAPAARNTLQNPLAPPETAARAALKRPIKTGEPDSAAAANAVWHQRAQRAGLQAAFLTPVQVGRPLNATAARRPEPTDTPNARAPAPAAPVANVAAVLFGARPGGAALPARDQAPLPGALSVLPRLNSVLDRLDRRSATARASAETPHEWRHAAAAPAHRLAAPVPGRIGSVAAQVSSEQAPASAAIGSAAEGRTTSGGLRGLAARAVAAQAASGWPGATMAGAATAAADTSMPTMPSPMQPRASDDEQLAEQFARVLRREAERDGIDVSDVMP